MTPTGGIDPARPDPVLLDRFVEVGLECLEREDASASVGRVVADRRETLGGALSAPRSPRSRWWGAALVAAGVLVTGWVLWHAAPQNEQAVNRTANRTANRMEGPAAPAPVQDPDRGRRLPEPVEIRGDEALAALEAAPVALRVFEAGGPGLAHLARLRGTQYLEVVAPAIEGSALTEALAAISSLHGLYLETDQGVDLTPLARLPVLERLSLHGVALDAAVLAPLAHFPALTRFDVRGCDLDAQALAAIGAIPGLRELAWTPTDALPVTALASFPKPERIRALALHQWRRLAPRTKGPVMLIADVTDRQSPYQLEVLQQFASLERLSLRPAREMPGEELRHLSGLGQLRDLDLQGCFLVGDDDLRHLPQSIERLDLSSTRWTGPLPESLRRLRVVAADGCRLTTDAAIAGFARFPQLRALRLRNLPALTNASAAALAALPLEELDLGGALWIGDDECRTLAAMATVRRLCVSGQLRPVRVKMGDDFPVSLGGDSSITVAGLAALLAAPALVELEVEQLGDVGFLEPPAAVGPALRSLAAGETILSGSDGQPLAPAVSLEAWQKLLPGVEVAERTAGDLVAPPPSGWQAGWATAWVERRS